MTFPIKSPRKLIEVALPLDAINVAAAREKSIRHGHPSTLHLWWARRPLAAARAVIFAQLVNDPGYQQGGGFKYGKNKKEAAIERKRLFKIIEDLVLWENTTNEEVLERARAEIRRSWREVCELNKDHPQAAELFNPEKLPALHDPFAGGGSIPLEAQRLGLEAYASDLNPVAVLINKAMIEIPPKFAGRAPVGPVSKKETQTSFTKEWPGATGLAEDVRRYGAWMCEEAQKRIGHLYPLVEITAEMAQERPDLKPLVGQKLTVIAWLWARTVKSPNPVFSDVDVPLVKSFVLATKEGKGAWIETVLDGKNYRFAVHAGDPPENAYNGTKATGRGSDFFCIMSETPIGADYIRDQARQGKFGQRLLAVVAEGSRERVYLAPQLEFEQLAVVCQPSWKPDVEFYADALGFAVPAYGLTRWSDLFSLRQLLALSVFCDLVGEVRTRVASNAATGNTILAKLPVEYSDAIATYLAFVVDKQVEAMSTLCTWSSNPKNELVVSTFRRQALSMTWDFAETNPFASSSGSLRKNIESVARVLESSFAPAALGHTEQHAAQNADIQGHVVATDPPYYDNIGYADLSDFFYVWLRRLLHGIYPSLTATLSTPKLEELVATPGRHGGKRAAAEFFLRGMSDALSSIGRQAHPTTPITIFYAFKQSETDNNDATSSTGWETFLEATLNAGLQLSGTWPMRTERPNRSRGIESNALASSIVLVCRKRPIEAPTISRREFLRELNAVLPEALDEMTKGSGEDRSPVAPVDLSQAIIGPGMAVFSKYSAVLEADGTPMSVRTALQLINRFLAEDDFDHDTQFCLHWFDQNGWKEGRFGEADVLARAKGTSVDGVKQAGVVESGGGIVRLCKWSEYPTDWDPKTDTRQPVWEILHHLIRALRQDGESGAGRIYADVRGKSESVRQLAYRLYTLCERRGWAEDARAYNELITSWSGIEAASSDVSSPPPPTQTSLFD